MSVREKIEEISAEIHKCYCRAYERRFGKPYWTNGDYSKLEEATKDYDREMARWHTAELIRELEGLKEDVSGTWVYRSNDKTINLNYFIEYIDARIKELNKEQAK